MTVAGSDARPLLPTGIAGPNRSGGIIQDPTPETIEIWRSVFDVNVLGSINVLKAFVPGLVEAGPLRSGKRTVVVTTSSSLGLYNMHPGPYNTSKLAVTAVCEQLSLELQRMGGDAAHVSSHSLHPALAATNFLLAKTLEDGEVVTNASTAARDTYLEHGALSADDVIDGLFEGLDAGLSYIRVEQ